MPYVNQRAINAFESGKTAKEVYDEYQTTNTPILNAYGDLASYRTLRRWHLYYQGGEADPESGVGGREDEITTEEEEMVFKIINGNPMNLKQISEAIDRSQSTALRIIQSLQDKGYNIRVSQERVEASTIESIRDPDALTGYLFDTRLINFAIVSDLHKGSREEQITPLRHFLKYAREQGIKHFLVPGDLTAGRNVYRGQDLDLYVSSSDAQLAAVRRDLDIQDDETWIILGGNHDFSHMKNGGTDPMWRFCREYPNAYFVGYDMADVPLTHDVSVRLWHPSGGKPYATSYRLQKGMEAMAYEQLFTLTSEINQEKEPTVKIIIAGHIHVDAKTQEGGVLGIQAACFEGQTNFLKRKSLYPQIGGYVVTIELDKDGNIVRSMIDHRIYKAIENDYLNYPPIENHAEADRLMPIFEGTGKPSMA